MDQNSTFHFVFASILTAMLAVAGWLFKSFIARFAAIEEKMNQHEIADGKIHTRLDTKSEEIIKRFDKFEDKLDNLTKLILEMRR